MEKENVKKIAEGVKTVVEKEQAVLFCYVFGSFVRGDAIAKSDVDVAIFFSTENREELFDQRLALAEKLTRALGKEVDVVVLNTASPFLRYTVLQEGLLVFERSAEARLDFELKATNEYFDYKPILQMYRDRLRASA